MMVSGGWGRGWLVSKVLSDSKCLFPSFVLILVSIQLFYKVTCTTFVPLRVLSKASFSVLL